MWMKGRWKALWFFHRLWEDARPGIMTEETRVSAPRQRQRHAQTRLCIHPAVAYAKVRVAHPAFRLFERHIARA